jgi:hypothetical protein
MRTKKTFAAKHLIEVENNYLRRTNTDGFPLFALPNLLAPFKNGQHQKSKAGI